MNKRMNKILAAFLVAGSSLSAGALAQSSATVESTTTDPATGATTTTTTTTTTERAVIIQPDTPLTRAERRDQLIESKADMKARKKIADAELAENKAACRTTTSGMVERACKKDAKAQDKLDKADAKLIHEDEKADIKASGQ